MFKPGFDDTYCLDAKDQYYAGSHVNVCNVPVATLANRPTVDHNRNIQKSLWSLSMRIAKLQKQLSV